jgi:hypothetical protein
VIDLIPTFVPPLVDSKFALKHNSNQMNRDTASKSSGEMKKIEIRQLVTLV